MSETLKQNWNEVKKQLKYCNDKELLGIIQNLYGLNKSNKEYLNFKFLAGNSKEHKEQLIKKTIDSIHLAWEKTFHDPYAYGGNTVIAKVTPIKAYVIAYKKAIGVDLGYVNILIEYVCSGSECLYSNCYERSDSILNSINSMAKELFTLMKDNSDYINKFTELQIKKIKDFTETYYIYDDVFALYQEIKL